MWVPVASFSSRTGLLIAAYIVTSITGTVRLTISNTSTNKVGRRRRRRCDIDHHRGMGGAGTVRVAHDQQGRTDHRGDSNFFYHRNRSIRRFLLRIVSSRVLIGGRHGPFGRIAFLSLSYCVGLL